MFYHEPSHDASIDYSVPGGLRVDIVGNVVLTSLHQKRNHGPARTFEIGFAFWLSHKTNKRTGLQNPNRNFYQIRSLMVIHNSIQWCRKSWNMTSLNQVVSCFLWIKAQTRYLEYNSARPRLSSESGTGVIHLIWFGLSLSADLRGLAGP